MTKNKNGFSLIELMIFLVLSSLIMIALLNFVVRNKLQHQRQALELQLENHLYYAKNYLEQAIRRAGYAGCSHVDLLNIHSEYVGLKLTALSGTRNTLQINYVDEVFDLPHDMKNKSEALVFKNTFDPKYTLMISDCHSADIFYNQYSTSYLIQHTEFQKSYKAHSDLARWNLVNFSVDKTKRKNNQGQFISALYSKNEGDPKKEEIVDHIVEMDLNYAATLEDFNKPASALPIDFKAIKIVKVTLKAAIVFQNTQLKKELVFFVTLRNRVN